MACRSLFGVSTGANRGPKGRQLEPELPGRLRDTFERFDEVTLDVVSQRLERREVQNLGAPSGSRETPAHQPIDTDQKGGQGLSRTGGGSDEGGASSLNLGPATPLGFAGTQGKASLRTKGPLRGETRKASRQYRAWEGRC